MNEPVTVRYDLAEVLKRIEDKIDTNQKDLTDLKIGQARLEEKLTGIEDKLSGDIKALDTKVDGLGKRLDYQEFINRGVVIALIIAILGGLAKIFGFVGNP